MHTAPGGGMETVRLLQAAQQAAVGRGGGGGGGGHSRNEIKNQPKICSPENRCGSTCVRPCKLSNLHIHQLAYNLYWFISLKHLSWRWCLSRQFFTFHLPVHWLPIIRLPACPLAPRGRLQLHRSVR